MNLREFMLMRYYEARVGYGVYLGYLITISTAVVVWYRFVVETIPWLAAIFTNLYVFAVLSVGCLLFIAMLAGHFLYVKGGQLRTEQGVMGTNNPRLMETKKNTEKILELLETRK